MKVVIDGPDRRATLFAGFLKRIEQYRRASKLLPEDGDVFFPRIQIRGQLVEVALKAYLLASGETLKKTHDLELLASSAEAHGLNLADRDKDQHIDKLNKLYFEHKPWDARYLTRYASENENLAAWITPNHNSTEEMVERIIDQAKARYSSD